MARRLGRSGAQGLAVTVLSGAVMMLLEGEVVAGGAGVVIGLAILYGYEAIAEGEMRRAADDAADQVDANAVLERTEDLTDDARERLRTWTSGD